MSWGEVSKSVYDLLNGDTGTGGLRNSSSSAYVQSLSALQAAKNPTAPYIVFSCPTIVEEPVFDPANKARDISLQIDIYSLANAGATAHEAIVARVKTKLDRQTLTVTGYTNGAVFLDSEQPVNVEGDLLRTVLQFSVFITDPS